MLLEPLTVFNNVGYELDMKGKKIKQGTFIIHSFSCELSSKAAYV